MAGRAVTSRRSPRRIQPASGAADHVGSLHAHTDGPSADTVAAEIAKLPAAQWSEIVSGHTADCSMHWVVVTSGDASDSPGQVLFFDRKTPIGTPTPEPRPYIAITPTGNDTASAQYQWRQGQDPACCPTGIATVRFKIEDGKLKALGPVPSP
jgi:hypothetical protein